MSRRRLVPADAVAPAATTRSVLSALRHATSAAHAETEKHPLLRPLMSPTLQRQQLARILCGFREFFALLEPGVTKELPALLSSTGYRYQPRVPLLVADIRDLAQVPPIEAGLCRDLAVSPSRNLLGVLYVVEGATQGGRVIAPRLARSLGVTASWGARYFHLYQDAQWSRLHSVLAREETICPTEPVIEAALGCFDLLQQVMDRVAPATEEGEHAG